MRSTLVGVIRVDPAELLEEGLLKELDGHISKKFFEFIEPQVKKPNSLLIRLEKLAESMDGYKRSLEYIQDYINIHGLRIWQKQVKLPFFYYAQIKKIVRTIFVQLIYIFIN